MSSRFCVFAKATYSAQRCKAPAAQDTAVLRFCNFAQKHFFTLLRLRKSAVSCAEGRRPDSAGYAVDLRIPTAGPPRTTLHVGPSTFHVSRFTFYVKRETVDVDVNGSLCPPPLTKRIAFGFVYRVRVRVIVTGSDGWRECGDPDRDFDSDCDCDTDCDPDADAEKNTQHPWPTPRRWYDTARGFWIPAVYRVRRMVKPYDTGQPLSSHRKRWPGRWWRTWPSSATRSRATRSMPRSSWSRRCPSAPGSRSRSRASPGPRPTWGFATWSPLLREQLAGLDPPLRLPGKDLVGVQLLHVLADEPVLHADTLAPVRDYLNAGGPDRDVIDRRRLQLAGRLARLFDDYALHRPELIAAWRAGEYAVAATSRSTTELWGARALAGGLRSRGPAGAGQNRETPRASPLWTRRPGPRPRAGSGCRLNLHLFGFSHFAETYHQLLESIASHTTIHVYNAPPRRSGPRRPFFVHGHEALGRTGARASRTPPRAHRRDPGPVRPATGRPGRLAPDPARLRAARRAHGYARLIPVHGFAERPLHPGARLSRSEARNGDPRGRNLGAGPVRTGHPLPRDRGADQPCGVRDVRDARGLGLSRGARPALHHDRPGGSAGQPHRGRGGRPDRAAVQPGSSGPRCSACSPIR